MEQVTHILQTFQVSWATFLASTINFVLLLFILKKFAFKPLLEMLEERKRRIEQSLKQAEQIKEELSQTQAARDEVLARANTAAQKMIDEARQAAEKFRDQKLSEALQQAQDTLRKANEAASLERDKILADLRKEMVQLVVSTTARVTGKILTADDQKRLADETLKELAA